MGKRAEQNKKRKRQAGNVDVSTIKATQTVKKAKPSQIPGAPPSPQSRSTSPVDEIISVEDLETTLLTLETLADVPEELARKDVKDVKRAVYALQRVMADGMTLGECFIGSGELFSMLMWAGTSLTSRISTALQDYRFTDALILLFEMYTRKLPPKLGSLQRWVRDCDATVSADGTVRDADAMKCLDLILRIANPASIAGPSRPDAGVRGNELIRRKPIWQARGDTEGEIAVWERMQNGTLFGECIIWLADSRTGS